MRLRVQYSFYKNKLLNILSKRSKNRTYVSLQETSGDILTLLEALYIPYILQDMLSWKDPNVTKRESDLGSLISIVHTE